MIVLAVQQGISSLPPTSSQSFSYEFDPEKDTYVRSPRLGPIVLRSPQTMGMGHFSLRLATSYFELNDSQGPIDYLKSHDMFCPPDCLTRIGLDEHVKVTLVNLAVTYGLSTRVELNANLPLVATHVNVSDVFLSDPAHPNQLVFLSSDSEIDEQLRNNASVFQRLDYHDAGADFPGATNFGVGRISVGSKALLYSDKRLRLSFAPEFFFPSPSENELAGSASAAIVPRAIAAFAVVDPVKLYVDAGYDYDFDHDELRHFVWTTGLSASTATASVDVGLGGSQFNQGIQWTPSTAFYPIAPGQSGTLTALGRTRLGTTFVDFLFGLKVRVTDKAVLGGAVNTAVNDEGVRADVIGTISLELYL